VRTLNAVVNRNVVAAVLVATGLCSGCVETQDASCDTLATREAQALVAQGWIPSILPASATQVRVRWDLDTNEVPPFRTGVFLMVLRQADGQVFFRSEAP